IWPVTVAPFANTKLSLAVPPSSVGMPLKAMPATVPLFVPDRFQVLFTLAPYSSLAALPWIVPVRVEVVVKRKTSNASPAFRFWKLLNVVEFRVPALEPVKVHKFDDVVIPTSVLEVFLPPWRTWMAPRLAIFTVKVVVQAE